MEDNFNTIDDHLTNSFDFHVLPNGKNSLSSLSNWTMFFSVLGILSVIFMLIAAMSVAAVGSSLPGMGDVYGMIVAFYIVFAIIYIIPVYFMLKFSTQMRKALSNKDNILFNEALGKLSKHFLVMGILTILTIVLYIGLIVAISAGAMSGMDSFMGM